MTDPITRAQLIDASTDADNLAHLLNDAAGNVIARSGRTLFTYEKIQQLGETAAASASAYAATAADFGTIWATPFDSIGASLPGSPAEGLKVINTADGTGNVYTSGAWLTFAPVSMQLAYVKADGKAYRYNSATGLWFYASATIDIRLPPFNAVLDGSTDEKEKYDDLVAFADTTYLTAYICGNNGGIAGANFDYTGKKYFTHLFDVICPIIGIDGSASFIFGANGYDSGDPPSSNYTRTVQIYGRPFIQAASGESYVDVVRFMAQIDSAPIDIGVLTPEIGTLSNASIRVQYSFDGMQLYGNCYGNIEQPYGLLFENNNCNTWDVFLGRSTVGADAVGVGAVLRGSNNRVYISDLSNWKYGAALETSAGLVFSSYFEGNVTNAIARRIDTAGPNAATVTGYATLGSGVTGVDLYNGSGYADNNTNMGGLAIVNGSVGVKLDWAYTGGIFVAPYCTGTTTPLSSQNGHFGSIDCLNRDFKNVNSLRFGDATTAGVLFVRDADGVLGVYLGDGSTRARIKARISSHANYVSGAPSPTGYLQFYDAAGTLYYIPAVAA